MSPVKNGLNQRLEPQDFQVDLLGTLRERENLMLHAQREQENVCCLGGILNESFELKKIEEGINVIWITPLRALAVEIQNPHNS